MLQRMEKRSRKKTSNVNIIVVFVFIEDRVKKKEKG